MYCIKCGVELSAGQTVCPICETKVYHPDIKPEKIPPKKEKTAIEKDKERLMKKLRRNKFS